MNFGYGWALSKPVRKVLHNITTPDSPSRRTDHRRDRAAPSSATSWASPTGPSWRSQTCPELCGIRDLALFVLTWIIAISVWVFGRIEDEWSADLQGKATSPAVDSLSSDRSNASPPPATRDHAPGSPS